MAFVTPIGANPEQIEYRLGGGHGCKGPGGGSDRQFSYRADGRERPLRWIGRGLEALGIHEGDELTEEQFDLARAIMNGRDPRTGETLVDAKRGVPDDAKVSVAALVRAIEAVAAEADVSVEEVLGGNVKRIATFRRYERAVASRGEAARARADEAGDLADAAGVPVDEVWGEDTFAEAAGNLWETVVVRDDDGTWREERRARRVIVGNAGYDLTVTLPKSFSLLLAFCSPELAAEIESIYMQATTEGFEWIQELAAYGQRGKHGNGHTATTVRGEGLLGWTMVHRAARPVNEADHGDPHWHVHISIANMTRGEDGKWSTIASGGRDLMRHAAALDQIVKSRIRHELTARYGIEFERNERSGAWEIKGLPDETLRRFSKRHADIKDMLERLGYDSEAATRAQDRIAEQRSRGAKGEATAAPDATLQELWQAEEAAAGHHPSEHIRHIFGGGESGENAGTTPPDETPDPSSPGRPVAPELPTVEELATQLLDTESGLTAHTRRFSRADALWRVADLLPDGAASADVVEDLTTAVLAHSGFVSLPDSQSVAGPSGEQENLAAAHMANSAMYTTDDVVDVEKVVLRAARASHDDQLSTRVSDEVAELGIGVAEAAHHPLGDEQRAALLRLVTSGRALDTVQGAPGTGKTTLMRALRTVYESAGYVVGGAATAAVASQNLQTESGITSSTIASIVHRVENGQKPLAGVDVLVVDEANLTEDRDRAALYLHAAATGTKIIEIGDGQQLRGVGIGSLFARVHEIVGGAELRHNRRQAHEDERLAVAAWRDGRYAEALTIWQERGQFVATETGDEITASMLAQWWEQRQGAPDSHQEMRGLVMLAATNEQVRRLNAAAQALRLTEGELGEARRYNVAGHGQLTLHTGDHVLLRVNDRAGLHVSDGAPVLNGYRAVITELHNDGGLTVEWQWEDEDGRMRTSTARLDAAYVARGGVELGYSMTIHKAEGLTVKDQWTRPDGAVAGGTVLFHAIGADNPAAYVAASRHRHQVYVYAPLEQLESDQERYLLGAPRTRQELHDRAIAALAQHARDTAEHGDDRPVVVDLGLEEFLSEAGHFARGRTERSAEEVEAERLRAEEQAARREERDARARRRAERERVRAERADERRHRRDAAELLLREVWRHEPSLLEAVLADAAFDAVARNLHDAGEAGYDLHEVLAEIPTETILSPRIHDKARFTAWSIDNAVERLRSGEAQRDHDRAAERARWEQMRDQAADLVGEAWAGRPELAEAVIQGNAFDAVVRGLDRYADAGLDVRGLLRQVSVDKLADPSIRDRSAFAAYAVHRVAERQLDEIDEAHRRAEERAEAAQHQDEAAGMLRQAWSHAPEAAEAVIQGNPFAFGRLVAEMRAAEGDGFDVPALLADLNPQALAAAPSPAGAAVFALRREIDRELQAEAAEPEATDTALPPQVGESILTAARAWARENTPTPTEAAEHDRLADPVAQRCAQINAEAAQFYRDHLAASPQAQDYLRGRGLDVDALGQRFVLGYAPAEWRAVTTYLQERGYSDQDLLTAGISSQARGGRLIDRFRDRVLVGIRDDHGNVAGFIGRPPHEDYDKQTPKYLNTPAGPLFDKSRLVFGLHESRDALAAGATPVLVEGPFDVLSVAGDERIAPLASSGTSVTEHHLAAIERAAGRDELVIALDGDAAGQAAAARTAQRAVRVFAETRIASLPEGHDPASWAQAAPDTQQAVQPYVDADQQQSAAEFLARNAIESYFAAHPPQHRDEVDGQLAAVESAARAIRDVDLPTATRTGLWISQHTGVDPVTVATKIGEQRGAGRSAEAAPPIQPSPTAAAQPEAVEHEHQAAVEEEIEHSGPVEQQPAPEPIEPVEGQVELGDGEVEHGEVEPLPQPWHERRFGQLDDAALDERATRAAQRAQRLAEQKAEAQAHSEALRGEVEAGQGPEVQAVEENLERHREQAEKARDATTVEETWQETVTQAETAAGERAAAEHELDTLGRFARARRQLLAERIAELTRAEEQAQQRAARLAERAAELQRELGEREQRRHIETRARAAEADYEHARQAAQRRDQAAVEAAQRQLARLDQQQRDAEQETADLAREQQVRAELPGEVRAAEAAARAEALQPAAAGRAHEAAIGEVEQAAIEHQADIEQQAEQDIDEPEL